MNSVLSADQNNVFYRCVEDSNEAIMITDAKGNLRYVNPAWSDIYGYSREEALGLTPRLLHSGYQTTDFYKKMWSVILNPAIGHWKGEVMNKAKNGSLIPVLLTITPIKNDKQEITGHMGIALDMSAHKQLEAKVLQQDRLASIGILASGLAHEVGTPLGVIRGRAEFMMMQQGSNQNQILSTGLTTIVNQIDRITKLISTLLRYSRATDDVCNQKIELISVVDEVTNLIGQSLKAAAIDLRVEIPSGMYICADFNRLQQVFLNLVVNALHALQKSNHDSEKKERAIIIRAQEKNIKNYSKVLITIADTGCGIPPENMKKLFQPFFTTKEVGQGTGLGLAIVSKLIQEMNGDIAVSSSLSVGTKFEITLNANSD